MVCVNPKQLQRMLKQMGIKARDLDVVEVTFVFRNGERWVFKDPQVIETEAMGQRSYQIVGTPQEEVSEEDVKIVMEKTGADREKAIEALKKAKGDIAEAIMLLVESQ